MQLASSARIPDGFMAAMRLGGEKPHQGLPGRNPALYQGPTVCNSTTALGLRGQAELNRVGSCSTGKERDTESGNDYFGARYYASAMGIWQSPDPSGLFFANPANPQSFDLYSFVRNNPLNSIDTNGMLTIILPGTYWDPANWNYQNPLVAEAISHFNEHHKLWLDQWTPRRNRDSDREEQRLGDSETLSTAIISHLARGFISSVTATVGT